MTRRTSLSLLALLLSTAATAQTSAVNGPLPAATAPANPVSESVTLGDLLQLAASAPAVRQAQAAEGQAQAALAAARAAVGLTVTAGGELNVTALGAAAAEGNTPAQDAEVSVGGTVTLDGSLAVLPWSPALERVKQAERALQSAQAQTAQVRREALLGTVRDYAGVLQALEGRQLAQRSLDSGRQALAAAQARVQNGLLDPAGLLDAEAAVLDAEAALARSVTGLDLAQRRLSSRVGRPVRLPLTALPAWPQSALTLPPLAELQAAALTRRPELWQARATVADAEAQVRAAELDARLPDASASLRAGQLNALTGGGLSASGSLDLKSGLAGAQVRVPFGGDDRYRTGVALNIKASLPLIGGGRAAALAQAQAGLTQAREGLTQAEEGVRLELDAAHSEAAYALDGLTAARVSLQSAQAALERTRARVAAGLDTPLDLTQAELRVLRAEQEVAQAERSARLAWLDLWRLSGQLEPELLQAALGLGGVTAAPAVTPASPAPAAPMPQPVPTTQPTTGGNP